MPTDASTSHVVRPTLKCIIEIIDMSPADRHNFLSSAISLLKYQIIWPICDKNVS